MRDADDDMVLEVAVNGRADAIVTFNRRDFRPATERFGIEVFARCGDRTIGRNIMRKSNFALRLQPSLLEEARKLAEAEGVALNQLINVAVAEKLSALRTADYFTARAARADIPKALKVLKRAGVGKPPIKGDELPPRKKRAKRQAA